MIKHFCLPACLIAACAMMFTCTVRGKALNVVCYAAAICLLSQSRKWAD